MRATAVAALTALAALAGTAGAEIRLPAAVDPGAPVSVEIFPGAGPAAELVIRPVGGLAGAETPAGPPVLRQRLVEGTAALGLAAPVAAGSYRVELFEGGRLRESAAFEVVASPVALSVPSDLPPSAPMEIRLGLGGLREALVQIEDAGGALVWERRIAAGEVSDGRLSLPAPALSGRYRLTLFDIATGRARASAEFSVDAGEAWFRAPVVVRPGQVIEVERHGPGGPGHALVVVAEADGRLVSETGLGGSAGAVDTLSLTVPRAAGRYRLRYLSRADGEVLADAPLIVTP